MIQIFTTDGTDDIVVKRTSAMDIAACLVNRAGQPRDINVASRRREFPP